MIIAVLDKLKSDNVLAALLEATENDSRIYPLETDNFGPCLVYTDTPMAGGNVRQNNLELRIITRSYALANAIEKRLNELLDFAEGQGRDVGWYADGINIMSSTLNGGGELRMGEIYERFPSYSIIWRYTTNA